MFLKVVLVGLVSPRREAKHFKASLDGPRGTKNPKYAETRSGVTPRAERRERGSRQCERRARDIGRRQNEAEESRESEDEAAARRENDESEKTARGGMKVALCLWGEAGVLEGIHGPCWGEMGSHGPPQAPICSPRSESSTASVSPISVWLSISR